MTTIVTTGGADRAPAIRLTTGHELEWSGKTAAALSITDVEAIHHFCLDEGFELGIEEAMGGKETPNPFHPRFLFGIPYSAYRTFYERGKASFSLNAGQGQEHALLGAA